MGVWQGLDHGEMVARHQVLHGHEEGCEEGAGKACVVAEVESQVTWLL